MRQADYLASFMDKEFADFFARAIFKSTSEFSKLIPILKENLGQQEYEKYSRPIMKLTQELTQEILFEIFDEHPDIDAKIKLILEKYGKLP
jgi:hypothetical protein